MNQHEHPAAGDAAPDPQPEPQLTRRQLLKAMGLTALGALPTSVVLPAVATAQTRRPGTSDDPRTIVAESPLVKLVTDALGAQSFSFRSQARVITEQGSLVGLALLPDASPSTRAGVALIVTVDRRHRDVTAVQLLQTWSLDTSLEVQRTTLTHSSMVAEEVVVRGGTVQRPGPRDEAYWSFPRAVAVGATANRPHEHGWPDAATDTTAWAYHRYGSTSWQTLLGTSVLSVTRVGERHAAHGERWLELVRE